YNAASGELIDRGAMLDPFLNSLVNFEHEEVGMVCGACLWIPKSLWDEIGGFPEFFHTLAEDMYLCCRARLKGHPVISLKYSGFKHWVGASLGGGKVSEQRLSTSFRRRSLTERNKCFAMAICYPFPIFQIIFPIHLTLLLAEGVILSLIERDSQFLKRIYVPVIRELWKHRELIFSLRQEVQATRHASIKEFFKAFSIIPYKLKMLIRYGLPEVR
ncbi:MAG: glycosyl transferase, partial [Desulfobacteraceae bacterium]|nr:glycosyl transferase [Desulfobacteraceae bacterium]